MARNNLDVVQAVKAQLEAQGVNLSGACGAFAITNEVARRVGFGLLRKAGGNRAIPQDGGGCLDGDHGSGPGYATDYIIDPQTFFGYDILGDGGGANNPQWPDEPETDAEMVKRNRENFASPVGGGPVPTPTPVPVPTPQPGIPGPQGPPGPKGDKGDKGDPGSDVDVSALLALLDRVKALETAILGKKIPTGVSASARIFGTNIPISAKLSYD
jgi:hypothetical protein